MTQKVLLWAGVGVSGVITLFGLAGITVAVVQFGAVRSNTLTLAAVLFVLGGAFFVPCLGVIFGFGPVVSTTLHSLGILGCIVVVLMVLNTAIAVTNPLGAGRLVVPWGTAALVVYRAWRGRWLGAGIIAVVWSAGTMIILVARS
jgi:hypothetical protein